MYAALDVTLPHLPRDRPRYLMGVGRPVDLLGGDRPRRRPVRLRDADAQRPQRAGVHRPRPAAAAQPAARARPRAARADCPCPACRHSRGYLRHLFQAGEMLGPMLLSIHNLTYYQRLLAARASGDRRGPIRGVLRASDAAGRAEMQRRDQSRTDRNLLPITDLCIPRTPLSVAALHLMMTAIVARRRPSAARASGRFCSSPPSR